jgi:single-stranded-DNA-specific exonuclease
MIRRGVRTPEDYRRFVAPELGDLHDATLIHGMSGACERIEDAVRRGETILVYGDYDVDGVTSIVLLQTVLRAIGADVDFVVPHRLVDGYGLKTEVLERVLVDRKVGLVITVDCGITSVEPVERALARGIDVIITDHHLPPGMLPKAAAVLNPRQAGCQYPFKELAGVGVAFKLCCALLQRFQRTMSIESLLKIAAIGTVADVAPLIGENRTIARLGLDGLREVRNHGLRALLRSIGVYGKPLRASDVGFRIGPRINAAGRLTSADTAIRLFGATSEADAYPMVHELERLNAERKEIGKSVLAAAESQIDSTRPLPRILILAGEGWHRGVLGLCAGKIAEKFHRPVLLMSIEDGVCIGSGRSIRTVDLHGCLQRVTDCFEHFGGHEFACGFSLRVGNLDRLRSRLGEVCEELDATAFDRAIGVDGVVSLGEFTRDLLAEHESLAPFGSGNEQPVFLTRGLRAVADREFGSGSHEITVTDAQGRRARAVVWKSVSETMSAVKGGEFDCLVEMEPDGFAPDGYRLVVRDAAPVGKALIRNEYRQPPV